MSKRQRKKFMFKGFHKKYKNAKRFSIKKTKGFYVSGTRRAHDVRFRALRKRTIDDLANECIHRTSEISELENTSKGCSPIEQMIVQFHMPKWLIRPTILAVLNESRRKLVINRCKELIEQGYD